MRGPLTEEFHSIFTSITDVNPGDHPEPFKVLIAAGYRGVDVKLAENFGLGVSNKALEFLKMNPIGKVFV
ncbi:hypothetical protein SLA2020_224060 [Shorea laevis]